MPGFEALVLERTTPEAGHEELLIEQHVSNCNLEIQKPLSEFVKGGIELTVASLHRPVFLIVCQQIFIEEPHLRDRHHSLVELNHLLVKNFLV